MFDDYYSQVATSGFSISYTWEIISEYELRKNRWADKFSRNTKMGHGFKIKPTHATKSSGTLSKKRYVAEIWAIKQSLLKHFGDIKDQAASHLYQKWDAAVPLTEIEVKQHSCYTAYPRFMKCSFRHDRARVSLQGLIHRQVYFINLQSAVSQMGSIKYKAIALSWP